MLKIRFVFTFSEGDKVVHVVEGRPVSTSGVTISDVIDLAAIFQGYVNRVTGLRLSIDTSYLEEDNITQPEVEQPLRPRDGV